MRIDDHEARFVVVEVTFDQGQRAFADRAEADHDNGAGNLGVDGVIGRAHQWGLRNRNALRARREIRMMGSESGSQVWLRLAVTSISIFISGFSSAATTSRVAAGLMSPSFSPQTA